MQTRDAGLMALRIRLLVAAFLVSTGFTVLETRQALAAGGAWSLLVDAGHNALHSLAILLILFATRDARLVGDDAFAKRLDSFVGRVLGRLFVLGGVGYLLRAGLLLFEPNPVNGMTVSWTGLVAMGNAAVVLVLLKCAGDGSQTLRGGVLDAIGDLAASLLLVPAGLAVDHWQFARAEPAAAAFIAALMIAFGIAQMRDSRRGLLAARRH